MHGPAPYKPNHNQARRGGIERFGPHTVKQTTIGSVVSLKDLGHINITTIRPIVVDLGHIH